MFRIIVSFLLLLFSAHGAFAQKTLLAQDSQWMQVNDHSWMLHINEAGRNETVYLMTVEKDLLFTSARPCRGSERAEIFTWTHGQAFALGTSCTGQRMRMLTRYWRPWVNLLPLEVRAMWRGSL